MHLSDLILVALALSLDAFAVSIASGIVIQKNHIYHALRFSFCFGFFQMFMPVLGWLAGQNFHAYLENIGHWVAFFLLLFIGLKMIYEAVKFEQIERVTREISFAVLIGLGLATSIDAFTVGLSLSLLNVSIVHPVLIIGLITFLMSFWGFFIGNKLGHIFEKKMEIIAGIILIFIGLKLLIENLYLTKSL